MIKRVLFFVAATLFFQFVFGQITTRQAAEKIEGYSGPPYDSLSQTITYENCRQFIGQDIFMLPYSKACIEKQKKMQPFVTNGFVLEPNRKTDPNRPKSNLYRSDYYAMAGKYLTVLDVIDKTDENKYGSRGGLYFMLKRKDNGDIVYHEIAYQGFKTSIINGPWIYVGYFEKMKKLNIGKTFVAVKEVTTVHDLNNGQPVSCAVGSEWICSDVTLLEVEGSCNLKPSFVFKNNVSNEIEVGLEYQVVTERSKFSSSFIDHVFKAKDEVLKEQTRKEQQVKMKMQSEQQLEAQRKEEQAAQTQMQADAEQTRVDGLIKKYGKNFGTKIANGQVELGMTKDMCLAAWGEPGNIRKTATANGGTNEKWFYGRVAFLYFKGNILAEMQE